MAMKHGGRFPTVKNHQKKPERTVIPWNLREKSCRILIKLRSIVYYQQGGHNRYDVADNMKLSLFSLQQISEYAYKNNKKNILVFSYMIILWWKGIFCDNIKLLLIVHNRNSIMHILSCLSTPHTQRMEILIIARFTFTHFHKKNENSSRDLYKTGSLLYNLSTKVKKLSWICVLRSIHLSYDLEGK